MSNQWRWSPPIPKTLASLRKMFYMIKVCRNPCRTLSTGNQAHQLGIAGLQLIHQSQNCFNHLWSLTKICCTHYTVQRVYAVLYRLRKNQETCRSKPSVVVVSCIWAKITLLSKQFFQLYFVVYHDLYNFFQSLVWRGFPFNHPCTEEYMKLHQRKNAALNHGFFNVPAFSGSLWQSGWKIQKSMGDVFPTAKR